MSQRLLGRDRQRLDHERFGRRKPRGAVIAGVRRAQLAVGEGDRDDGVDIGGIERERALEQLPGLDKSGGSSALVGPAHALKIEIHRVGIRSAFGPPGFGDNELRVEGVGEAGDDFILHVEEVRHRLVEPLRPEMIAVFAVDQLHVHAHAIGRTLDAALEHIADVELASDLFEVDRLVLVAEGGVAPDDHHPAHL